jgi:hypothetical protein
MLHTPKPPSSLMPPPSPSSRHPSTTTPTSKPTIHHQSNPYNAHHHRNRRHAHLQPVRAPPTSDHSAGRRKHLPRQHHRHPDHDDHGQPGPPPPPPPKQRPATAGARKLVAIAETVTKTRKSGRVLGKREGGRLDLWLGWRDFRRYA